MQRDELRALQGPLKDLYRDVPDAARIVLKARGKVGEGISCSVDTHRALAEAGLHPATGGTGLLACSGDMLLEALVACAGVTLAAVATSVGIDIGDTVVRAEGEIDFRGTLGVAKETPVGFQRIRLFFDFGAPVSDEDAATLLRLTERYCVVFQTLRGAPEIAVARGEASGNMNPV